MYDKSKELNTNLVLVNDKLHFNGKVDNCLPVSIDYIPPLGDGLGYTSLELLLLSLTSCLASSVLTFLRKMQKSIESFEINAKGIRKQEHPTGFETIYIDINYKSKDVKPEDIDKVLKLSEDTYCPVWAMLKGNVNIDVRHKNID